MSKIIYKYPLSITDRQTISLPVHRQILKVSEQDEVLMLWAIVDTENEFEEEIIIEINGTGNELIQLESNELRHHIDTVVTSYGMVWHVFSIFQCIMKIRQ